MTQENNQAKVYSRGDVMRYSCNLMHDGQLTIETPMWDALAETKDDEPVGTVSVYVNATGITIFHKSNDWQDEVLAIFEFYHGGARIVAFDTKTNSDDPEMKIIQFSKPKE